MEKNILFENSAVKYVLDYLMQSEDYISENIEYLNNNRYCVSHTYKGDNIAILFKKDWFYKFGVMFKGESGIGDSINCQDLKEFSKRKVKKIYILHKTGCLYMISMFEFLRDSYRWINKEGKEVRSISIHRYLRVI